MVFEGCFQQFFRTQFVDKKLAPRGPEQFEKSKTALRDQFQDTHFVVNPKCIKNPDWREQNHRRVRCIFSVSRLKTTRKQISKWSCCSLRVCVSVFFGRNHTMGVKNPAALKSPKSSVACLSEKRTTTPTHLVGGWKETCHFVGAWYGMRGGVGIETPHKY